MTGLSWVKIDIYLSILSVEKIIYYWSVKYLFTLLKYVYFSLSLEKL